MSAAAERFERAWKRLSYRGALVAGRNRICLKTLFVYVPGRTITSNILSALNDPFSFCHVSSFITITDLKDSFLKYCSRKTASLTDAKSNAFFGTAAFDTHEFHRNNR